MEEMVNLEKRLRDLADESHRLLHEMTVRTLEEWKKSMDSLTARVAVLEARCAAEDKALAETVGG